MTSVAQRLRQKLLDLAIHGKLVPQDPKDEPADELLARIRKARSMTGRARTPDAPLPIPEEEIPFDLPRGWVWCRLTDIAEIQLGKMLDAEKNKGKPFRYLANVSVRWGSFDVDNLKTTRFTDGEIGKFALKQGDLLMCEGGVPGRCAVWRECDSEIKYQKALHRIRPCEVLPDYLQMYFEAIYQRPFFTERFTGSTIHHLPREVLMSVPVPLPPLAEQKRIVENLNEMLKEATRVAEGTERLAQLRKKARAKILDLAIRGKLVKQEKSDEPASELLARIRALREGRASARPKGAGRSGGRPGDRTRGSASLPEEPFELPQGWAWCRFEDVAYSIASKPYQVLESTVNSTGMYPVVSQGQKEIDGYSDDSGKVFRDVPVVIFGDHTRNVKFRDRPFIVGADGTKLFKPLVDAEWMYYWTLYSAEFQIEARGYQRHWSKLVTLPIPLPPLAEQRRIVTKVKEMLAACDALGGHV